MKKQQNKKGISLIVLMITIIVIIILALAVILSIAENNPIENARKARFQNDLRTIQEEVSLYIGKKYADTKGTYKIATDNFSEIEIPDGYVGKVIIKNGKVKLTEEATDLEISWAKEIQVETTYKPTIPVGFKYLEGTVEEGYVIVNETDGNEFVWVPVDDIDEFIKEDGYESGAVQLYVSSGESTEPYSYNGATADASEIAEYNSMMKSVEKYHGFYIGRYEASNNGSDLAQSKKDEEPWISIKWGNSMTDLSGGAVEKARAVYSNSDKAEDSKYAVSTLIYGVQWDQTVRWIKETYPGIEKDSSGYGNYKTIGNGTRINTGSNPEYKTNNIYDLAGNVYEWTMEAYLGGGRIYRGGCSSANSINFPVSVRGNYNPNLGYYTYGFRLALYIK